MISERFFLRLFHRNPKNLIKMKNTYLILLLFAASLTSFGTIANNTEPTPGKRVLCSETNLVSTFNAIEGTVAVYVLDGTLMVKFQANGRETLKKTRLYVGEISNLPTNTDDFNYKGSHAKGTNIVTYDIEVATLKSSKIVIAAYSEINGNKVWAGTTGNSNIKYYEFDLNACTL